jgi:glucan phosphorylase
MRSPRWSTVVPQPQCVTHFHIYTTENYAILQDVLSRFKDKHGTDFAMLPEKAIFQLNDTHPTIGVAELMRLLVDVEGLAWEKAKKVTTACIAFTNHTVMPEALERWPVEVMDELLPRHVEIIQKLDKEWCATMLCTVPVLTSVRDSTLLDFACMGKKHSRSEAG